MKVYKLGKHAQALPQELKEPRGKEHPDNKPLPKQ